ncbi:MAG: hypothetical protein A2X86_21540 [Bdellovibrionales bacterium GWA2_49_15]|nr:MAG: hypothetical protein A2X86_21540 [Bdellovibrionales bacterium GWA2_49_15]HAZ14964.1 hypothetical protein [Bdellovibrionales bacterium]
MSTIASQVKNRIDSFQVGKVIAYSDFEDISNTQAVALFLSRLVKAGTLKRIGKGKYYVPEETKFGSIGPSESAILESIMKETGGYITGPSVYNALGLTTQVANRITVVGNKFPRKAQLGKIKVRYVQAKFPIIKEDVYLLQLLDAIKDIRTIMDTTIDDSIDKIKAKIRKLDENQISKIIDYATKYYRPYVRATLGAIMDEFKNPKASLLKETLTPLTVFKIGFSDEVLPKKKDWNFV